MIERPILFSEAMVRAVLRRVAGDDGTPKTQTRRVNTGGRCRYGESGDRLWVRERMRVIDLSPPTHPASVRVRYEADGAESALLPYPARLKGEPAIGKCLPYGGYREASRIVLGVASIRSEPLHAITPADILAEGVRYPIWRGRGGAFIVNDDGTETALSELRSRYTPWRYVDNTARLTAETMLTACFAALWDSINAARGYPWASNPRVDVVTFELISVATFRVAKQRSSGALV